MPLSALEVFTYIATFRSRTTRQEVKESSISDGQTVPLFKNYLVLHRSGKQQEWFRSINRLRRKCCDLFWSMHMAPRCTVQVKWVTMRQLVSSRRCFLRSLSTGLKHAMMSPVPCGPRASHLLRVKSCLPSKRDYSWIDLAKDNDVVSNLFLCKVV